MTAVARVICLICSQQPASGVVRRVYVDTGDYVVTALNMPVPRVCLSCGQRHDESPGKVENCRETVWVYEHTEPEV